MPKKSGSNEEYVGTVVWTLWSINAPHYQMGPLPSYVYIYVCIYVYIHMCVSLIYIHIHIHIYIFVCVCVYIHIYVCLTHIYTYIHIYTHMYVCVCVCIWEREGAHLGNEMDLLKSVWYAKKCVRYFCYWWGILILISEIILFKLFII